MTINTLLLDPDGGGAAAGNASRSSSTAFVVHQSGEVLRTEAVVAATAAAPAAGSGGGETLDGGDAFEREWRVQLQPTQTMAPTRSSTQLAQGGGGPLTFSGGSVDATRGSVLLTTVEDRGAIDDAAAVTTLRDASAFHASAGEKRFAVLERAPSPNNDTTTTSAAPEPSRLRLSSVGAAMMSADRQTQGASVWAMGAVQIEADTGQARWVWQSGHFAENIEASSLGQWRLRMAPSRGLSRSQAVVLVAPRGELQPGGMVTPTVRQFTFEEVGRGGGVANLARVTDKIITLRAETATAPGGAPSLGGIEGFDVVVLLSEGRGDDPAAAPVLRRPILGALRFQIDTTTTPPAIEPVLAYRSEGLLQGVERVGPGQYVVELHPRAALSPERSVLLASPHGVSAGGRLRAVAVTHLSPTKKQLTMLREVPPEAVGGDDEPTPPAPPSPSPGDGDGDGDGDGTDTDTGDGGGGGDASPPPPPSGPSAPDAAAVPSVRASFDVDFAFFQGR